MTNDIRLLELHNLNTFKKRATSKYPHIVRYPISATQAIDVAAIVRRLNKPPITLIHLDARYGNTMMKKSDIEGDVKGDAKEQKEKSEQKEQKDNAKACLIDWGGINNGRGVYDVAYLLGTSMDDKSRQTNETELVRYYHKHLTNANDDIARDYSFEECLEDYHSFQILIAVLYCLPGGYDQGTTTESNTTIGQQSVEVARANLQPILDRAYKLKSKSA
jgi:thiamine kinase-like enzyme